MGVSMLLVLVQHLTWLVQHFMWPYRPLIAIISPTSEALPSVKDHGEGLCWSPCVDLRAAVSECELFSRGLAEISRLVGHRLAIFLHLKCMCRA